MTDITDLEQAAKVTVNDKGETVIQIPLSIWQEFVIEQKPTANPQSQIEGLRALLEEWENEPDDTPEEWWDEFQQFLKDNRFNIPEQDLGLGDE